MATAVKVLGVFITVIVGLSFLLEAVIKQFPYRPGYQHRNRIANLIARYNLGMIKRNKKNDL